MHLGYLRTSGRFRILFHGRVHKVSGVEDLIQSFFCTFTFLKFVIRTSIANSASSSPKLQFFASSVMILWNFLNFRYLF